MEIDGFVRCLEGTRNMGQMHRRIFTIGQRKEIKAQHNMER
jgi:hypothetical protein